MCLRGPLWWRFLGRELPEDESVDAPASQSRAWTLADYPLWREGRWMDGVPKRTRVGKRHVPCLHMLPPQCARRSDFSSVYRGVNH